MRARSGLGTLWLDHRPLVGLTGLYVVAVWLALWWAEVPARYPYVLRGLASGITLGGGFLFVLGLFAGVVAGLTLLAQRIVLRGPEAVRAMRTTLRVTGRVLHPLRLGGALVVLVLLGVLLSAFVALKGAIPAIHPFAWDAPLMRADRWLHGGNHPWELLQPWFGTPLRVRALDVLYYWWFPVKLIVLCGVAWMWPSARRMRFLLAFALLWIVLGSVLALWFSSVGPVYYERVIGSAAPFGALTAWLQEVNALYPLTALEVRDLLWTGYVDPGQLVEGIAAMPSLHVAVPMLFALFLWRTHWSLGVLFGLYTLAILVGSVVLAWHYALDGYVSLLLTPLIWWGAGRLVGRGREEAVGG